MNSAHDWWTDEQLIQELVIHMDQQALAILHARHQPNLLAAITRLLGKKYADDENCESIAEHVWLRLVAQLQGSPKFDPRRSSLAVYLALLAGDAAHAHKLRAHQRRGPKMIPLQEQEPEDPSAGCDWTLVAFQELMQTLPETERCLLEEELTPQGPAAPQSKARRQKVYRLWKKCEAYLRN